MGLEKVLGGSGNPAYPGGQFFNLMKFEGPTLASMKEKEVKNGRLAMVAMLGAHGTAGEATAPATCPLHGCWRRAG